MSTIVCSLALGLVVVACCATGTAGQRSVVENMPGLVAFWTFGEEGGRPRVSTGTREAHALQEVGGPIARVEGGPFSGYSAELNGRQYFRIPYAETGDLNIAGPDAQVSLFAVVRIVNLRQSRTIAGMWSEGRGPDDDTGTRQYALLMNMGEATIGRFGGLAVFNRALAGDEAMRWHEAAGVEELPP